ncbi:flagellar hook protein FlgE [Evansella cellulosilytica]|uniref:Flagellar hook protein FlgE n=1 Tax=Evansella cellulosilytica (strain ATCC 21833 / DSM 2522 / FERM P-1141 / JCM 9156 / N-4) TaxID=649639 RepID=E6TSV9_EVAC2|nr:flagellar hook protein FlgE [Evansella cellulosilytica]ADU30751.1 flagellar hook-basal body protein [Evansella cellulosilytica DSM 2522]
MIRAMYAGIGGMKSFQTKLDVVGNNIANVNTSGFKKGRVTFQDLVSQQMSGAATPTDNRGGINPMQVGLGTSMGSIDTIHTQGSLQTTGRDLDIGITGDGFFIVNDGGQSYYSRAGNFYLDENGDLVNANGLRVQGYSVVDGELDTNTLGPLQIASGQLIPPQATDEAQFKGNLNSETQVGETVNVPYPVIDSLGNMHYLELTFQKQAGNEWTVQAGGQALGNVNFGNDGSFVAADDMTVNFNPGNNANPLNIELDFSRMSQYARNSTADIHYVSGNVDGTLESYSISQAGEIMGVFSNGEVRLLGQIALATFNNPGGLSKSGNNLYMVSNNSGNPQVGLAGDGGRGMLTGASLEMSNVDLSEEFTEMIVAQRGFQANTRMITTSDEILQELVNLKR